MNAKDLATVWILLCLCLWGTANAQGMKFPHRAFTNRDGLSQLQVRSLFEDSRGYLWIGTQRAINQYDGHRILSYGQAHGIPDEQVLGITEDGQGKIWYATQKYLVEFDGINAKKHPFPKPLPFPYISGQGRRIWVSYQSDTYIFEDGRFKQAAEVFPSLKPIGISGMAFSKPGEAPCLFTKRGEIFLFRGEQLHPITPPNNLPKPLAAYDLHGSNIPFDWDEYSISFLDTVTWERFIGGIRNDSLFIFASNDGKSVRYWENPLDSIPKATLGHPGQFYHSVSKKGPYQRASLPFPAQRILLRSRFGPLYIGTDQGLVQVWDQYWQIPQGEFQYPWAVTEHRGRIAVSDYLKGLLLYEHAWQEPQVLKASPYLFKRGERIRTEFLPGAVSIGPGLTAFGSNEGIHLLYGNVLEYLQLNQAMEALFFDPASGEMWAAGRNVFKLDPYTRNILDTLELPLNIHQKTSCTALTKDSLGNLWVAGLGGLYRFGSDGSEKAYTYQEGTLPCHGALALLDDRRGGFLLGGTQGLFGYEPASDRFSPILESFIDETVNSLLWLDGNSLAVATDKTLFILQPKYDGGYGIRYAFDENNGNRLLEPAQNGLFLSSKGHLWIPAANGIQILDWAQIKARELKLQHVARLVVQAIDEKSLLLTGRNEPTRIRQPRGFTRISLDYIGSGPASLGFRYSVNDGPWSERQPGQDFFIQGLKRGQNRVRVRADLNLDDESQFPETELTLYNEFPVYQTPGFLVSGIALLSLALAGVGLGLVRQQRRTRQMEKIKEKLELNQLQGIYNQLNPHFLNNVITTIQYALVSQTKTASSQQLVELSKMLRHILKKPAVREMADLQLDTLSEEIAFLNRYLTFQQKLISRFETFSIEADEALSAHNPLLPKMLLQPFVENALKHGIEPGDQSGRLWIRFFQEREVLVIEIADDGIGRERAVQLQQEKGRHSTGQGLRLIGERIRLLGSLGYPISWSIDDRSPSGTKVTISFPQNQFHACIHR